VVTYKTFWFFIVEFNIEKVFVEVFIVVELNISEAEITKYFIIFYFVVKKL